MDEQVAKERRAHYEDMVKGPGKFEGEPPWTPYFYDVYLMDEGEYISDGIHEIEILSEDPEIFPEILGHKKARVYFSEQGFISSELL